MVGSMFGCTNQNEELANELEELKEKNKTKEMANKVVEVMEEGNWDLSPIFEHSVVYENGNQGSYEVVGNRKTVGFTGPFPLIAEEPQKYFWFYYGNKNIYDKPVIVKALKKGTEELIDVFSGTFYKDAKVSPQSVNMPSTLKFPSSGLWKVLVYIDDELYESIVVEVAE